MKSTNYTTTLEEDTEYAEKVGIDIKQVFLTPLPDEKLFISVEEIIDQDVEDLLEQDEKTLKKLEFEQTHNDFMDCDILCSIEIPKTILDLQYELIKAKEEVLRIEKEILFKQVENG